MSTRTEQRIIEIAEEIAEHKEARSSEIEKELREIEAQKAAKEAELNTAKLAFKRSLSFQVRVGADLQCPSCWIDRNRRSVMVNINGTDVEDVFRCRVCRLEIGVPF